MPKLPLILGAKAKVGQTVEFFGGTLSCFSLHINVSATSLFVMTFKVLRGVMNVQSLFVWYSKSLKKGCLKGG